MQLKFNTKLANKYKSQSQAIKIMTENWVGKEIFCPNCGSLINNFENNRPVADFYCQKCLGEYELKSKKKSIGKKIVDGAYNKMVERLKSDNNPSFSF